MAHPKGSKAVEKIFGGKRDLGLTGSSQKKPVKKSWNGNMD